MSTHVRPDTPPPSSTPGTGPDRARKKAALVAARQAGATLARAAAAVGVHVATVCRWQVADPKFGDAMRSAALAHDLDRYRARPATRPAVRWRNECPDCRARLVVRAANGRVPFWRCGRWPLCRWASWRPRHPRNCPDCLGPRFWSHSRKSVGCDWCGVRISAP